MGWMILEGVRFGFGFCLFFFTFGASYSWGGWRRYFVSDGCCFCLLFLKDYDKLTDPRNSQCSTREASFIMHFTPCESRFSERSHSGSVRLPNFFSVTTFSTECCKNSRLPEIKWNDPQLLLFGHTWLLLQVQVDGARSACILTLLVVFVLGFLDIWSFSNLFFFSGISFSDRV